MAGDDVCSGQDLPRTRSREEDDKCYQLSCSHSPLIVLGPLCVTPDAHSRCPVSRITPCYPISPY